MSVNLGLESQVRTRKQILTQNNKQQNGEKISFEGRENRNLLRRLEIGGLAALAAAGPVMSTMPAMAQSTWTIPNLPANTTQVFGDPVPTRPALPSHPNGYSSVADFDTILYRHFPQGTSARSTFSVTDPAQLNMSINIGRGHTSAEAWAQRQNQQESFYVNVYDAAGNIVTQAYVPAGPNSGNPDDSFRPGTINFGDTVLPPGDYTAEVVSQDPNASVPINLSLATKPVVTPPVDPPPVDPPVDPPPVDPPVDPPVTPPVIPPVVEPPVTPPVAPPPVEEFRPYITEIGRSTEFTGINSFDPTGPYDASDLTDGVLQLNRGSAGANRISTRIGTAGPVNSSSTHPYFPNMGEQNGPSEASFVQFDGAIARLGERTTLNLEGEASDLSSGGQAVQFGLSQVEFGQPRDNGTVPKSYAGVHILAADNQVGTTFSQREFGLLGNQGTRIRLGTSNEAVGSPTRDLLGAGIHIGGTSSAAGTPDLAPGEIHNQFDGRVNLGTYGGNIFLGVGQTQNLAVDGAAPAYSSVGAGITINPLDIEQSSGFVGFTFPTGVELRPVAPHIQAARDANLNR